MAHHPAMRPMALLYGTRDRYQGEFKPPVAAPHEPVRTVSMRRSGDCVLLAIADGSDVNYWRVSNPDDARLQALSAGDRNNAQSALTAICREAINGA